MITGFKKAGWFLWNIKYIKGMSGAQTSDQSNKNCKKLIISFRHIYRDKQIMKSTKMTQPKIF
jgi:hypothetical protein